MNRLRALWALWWARYRHKALVDYIAASERSLLQSLAHLDFLKKQEATAKIAVIDLEKVRVCRVSNHERQKHHVECPALFGGLCECDANYKYAKLNSERKSL